jgi:hypothetical protein
VSNAAAISGSAQRPGPVRAAVSRFWRTNIGRFATVVTAVQTDAVPATATYNLTVEHDHVYYANGALVENCLTFAQPMGPVKPTIVVSRSLGPAGWMT